MAGLGAGAAGRGHDGSGAGDALAVIAAGAVAAALAGPILAAVARLLMAVLIAAAVALGVTITGLLALIVFRLRRNPSTWHGIPQPPLTTTPRVSVAQPAGRPAIEAPRELHLHLHNVGAEDLAAILRHHTGKDGPS